LARHPAYELWKGVKELNPRLYRLKQSATEVAINLGLVMLSIFLIALSSDYPQMARTVPQLVLILVIILASLDILSKVWVGSAEKSVQEKDTQEIEESARGKTKVLFTVGLMFVFLFSMLIFGFTLGTFIFLICSVWSLGYKNKKGLIISSLIITGFMYVIFILIMKSFLPSGLLFDILRG
jgi:hypothetical protein